MSEASQSARCALTADPIAEPAYRMPARVRLAESDLAGARRALQDCRTALADPSLRPDHDTITLLDQITSLTPR